jgi:hypothetical protein
MVVSAVMLTMRRTVLVGEDVNRLGCIGMHLAVNL